MTSPMALTSDPATVIYFKNLYRSALKTVTLARYVVFFNSQIWIHLDTGPMLEFDLLNERFRDV